jgi:hypothetical protein
MYCPKCGYENPDTASRCARCGGTMPTEASLGGGGFPMQGQPIANNLVWAILATLFCCLPTGIVAIVYAAQVDSKLAAGDRVGALRASQLAGTWSWVSLALAMIVIFLYGVLVVIGLSAR